VTGKQAVGWAGGKQVAGQAGMRMGCCRARRRLSGGQARSKSNKKPNFAKFRYKKLIRIFAKEKEGFLFPA
jgi:hypothetical protein